MSGGEFSLGLRVYIEDTDAGGIVYYVNYLKFMERARTEFMRSLGFGKDYIFNRDLMFVVRDVAVEYRRHPPPGGGLHGLFPESDARRRNPGARGDNGRLRGSQWLEATAPASGRGG